MFIILGINISLKTGKMLAFSMRSFIFVLSDENKSSVFYEEGSNNRKCLKCYIHCGCSWPHHRLRRKKLSILLNHSFIFLNVLLMFSFYISSFFNFFPSNLFLLCFLLPPLFLYFVYLSDLIFFQVVQTNAFISNLPT